MKFVITLFFTFLTSFCIAQADLGIPSITGMGGAGTTMLKDWEVIGVNPANLGFENTKRVSIGILNYGISVQSNALNLGNLANATFNSKKSINNDTKAELENLFANNGEISFNSNVNWLAASIKIPKIGGFAINLRDRVSFSSNLNPNLADVVFNGSNAAVFKDNTLPTSAELFNNSSTQYLHYRELNLAYGTRIAKLGANDSDGNKKIELFGGIGYKILWGIGNLNVTGNNGNFAARSSISESLDVNYGEINNFQAEKASNLFNSAGSGFAFDFGATLVFDKTIKFAASVIDLGQINWKNNVLEAGNDTIKRLSPGQNGLTNFNILNQANLIYGNTGLLNFNKGNAYTSQLNTSVRLGTGIAITKKIEIAYDVIFPLNELTTNLKSSYFAIGGQVNILNFVTVSTGYAGNNTYDYSIPLGFKFATYGFTEFSIATNDILAYFKTDGNSHMSFAIGVLRFNIP